jgi:hypothetical protein
MENERNTQTIEINADKLKQLRLDRWWSIEDIHWECNISKSCYIALEQWRNHPKPFTVKRLIIWLSKKGIITLQDLI